MSCRVVFYLIIALSVLAGCNKPMASDPAAPGSPAPIGPYYDVRHQLDSLVQVLDARHAGVQKQVSLGGPVETKRVARVKWADELQLFYQADINKAALRGAYDVKITPVVNGLFDYTRYEYRRKPNVPNAPVVQLRISCYPGRRLFALEATIEQHNVLFDSAKQLYLNCGSTPENAITYDVHGQQKLVLFDMLRFNTSARVQ